jgi:hypothetical protein
MPTRPAESRVRIRTWEWWVPYLSCVLIVVGWSLTLSNATPGSCDALLAPVSFARGLVALGGILFVMQLGYALQRRSVAACFVLAYAAVLVSTSLIVVAHVLREPPSASTNLQASLQRVLDRRASESNYDFHGVRLHEKVNRFGWHDDEPRANAALRYAFVGDSFLEVRSSRNLARRVEGLLHEEGLDVEILNYSVSDTGPNEYRHRFYEVALPERPDGIVLFLYGGNDLLLDFEFAPYVHPEFRATRASEAFAASLSPALGRQMRRLRRSEVVFRSREEFLSHLRAPEGDAPLLYLAALAYSTLGADPDAPIERVRALLRRGARAALTRIDPAVTTFSAESSGCLARDWSGLWDEYQRIFDLPPHKRLEAIGTFVAERYCGRRDDERFVAVLERQSPEFRQFLIEQADMPYFLFPAVATAALRGPEAGRRERRQEPPARSDRLDREEGGVHPATLTRAVNQYVDFLCELRDAAAARGTRFIVVLIPEATLTDASFRMFWSGFPGFERTFAARNALHRALAAELSKTFELLDLASYPNLLDACYWPLDGHLNEAGNARVAELLARKWLR